MIEPFVSLLQAQFDKMCASGKLFRSKLSGDKVWDVYLKSFPEEYNPIFRDPSSTTHNCNLCKNFIRRYGNIVAIDETYEIVTIFDVEGVSDEYSNSANAVSKAIKQQGVENVFFETLAELISLPYESCSKTNIKFQLGVNKNVKRYTKEEAEKYGVVKPNEIRTFNHLHLFLPAMYVDKSGKSIESIMAFHRDNKTVFQRAMQEIPLDTLYVVRDLINQGSLLDGATHLYKVESIIAMKVAYDTMLEKDKDNWCWVNSYNFPLAKFKNELIGVLCTELAEGKELNEACQAWNKRVDPANYMKAVAPITKRQIEEVKKFVEENGYEESFNRRFATIDDIKASEILHVNVGKGEIKSVSLFDGVKPTSTRHKRSEFDGVEEIGIEKFMSDILPTCTSVEAFLTNKHEGNLVSLTTANVKESKPIFKWSNNYSWTFNGNLAGKSQIKQAVKDAGGNVDGVLNFRLAWNQSGSDNSDLDLWADEPSNIHIGFSAGYRKDRRNYRTPCSGQLDVDNTCPGSNLGVENITWIDKSKMKDGVYTMYVHQYSDRGSLGFEAEIEIEGDVYHYNYPRRVSGKIKVASIALDKRTGKFDITHHIPESEASVKQIYSLDTNQFHKVNLVCLSPNHWGDNNIGNKHYFFMLQDCKCPTSIRSFHAENLIPELATHRKVLEVLGNTTMITPSEKQLSGLGFNATVRDELIVKVQGSFKRMLKIKF